jgi:hypothetical protein
LSSGCRRRKRGCAREAHALCRAALLAVSCAVLTCRLLRAQGASVLQVHYITPLLHKHENAIDSVLDDTIKKVRACTAASGYPGRDV